MVFGLAFNADHAAHAFGFVSGALLGYALSPTWVARAKSASMSVVMGAIGVVVTTAITVIILKPPALPRAFASQLSGEDDEASAPAPRVRDRHESDDDEDLSPDSDSAFQALGRLGPACELLDQGKSREALARARADLPANGPNIINNIREGGRYLADACEFRKVTIATCERLETEGFRAMWPHLKDGSPARERAARSLVEECTALLGRPVVAPSSTGSAPR
jgi:hypothetical protein